MLTSSISDDPLFLSAYASQLTYFNCSVYQLVDFVDVMQGFPDSVTPIIGTINTDTTLIIHGHQLTRLNPSNAILESLFVLHRVRPKLLPPH